MELQIDDSREYGIVLEGGGARGAYQIGAWRALREAGIRIRGISGASVGALNGALMCMDDLEKAEKIWETISYSKVMDVDDELMEKIWSGGFSAQDLGGIAGGLKKALSDGGFDVAPLRRLIEETVDEEKIRTSERELFIVTYSVSDKKKLVLRAREIPEGEIGDMLLASAYFLAFKREKLGGKRYMDGGGVDNVPIEALLEQGCRDLIVIRVYGLGRDSERSLKIPEDANLYHIAPRQSLGGILEFSGKKTRKSMALGYFDAMRMLYGLAGRSYYIDAPGGEAYYFDRIMSELEALRRYVELPGEGWESPCGCRAFTEQIFPQMARQLRLRKDWDYRDLYLRLMEKLARRMRVNRFHIYTVQELAKEVYKELSTLDSRLAL